MQKIVLIVATLALSGCGPNRAESVEREIRMQLRDPEAVQFDDISQCAGAPTIWTGRLNTKNGFGAYTGFQYFYYDGISVYLEGDAPLDIIKRCSGT